MKPKISYRVSKDNLKIRIKIHGLEAGLYDTGIFCPKEKFDVEKQISGYTNVQNYMDSASESLRKLFTTGMTAENLWNEFLKQRAEILQTHTVKDAFDYYFRNKKVSDSTITSKEILLGHLADHKFDKKLIRDMNGATQREFLGKLDHLSQSSLHAIYVGLNTVLGYYIDENSLPIELPKGLISAPKAKESDEDEYLTWSELQKLLATELEDKDEQQYLDFFCLLCLTGMAAGDGLKFTPKTHISEDGKWFKYKRQKTGSKCLLPLLPPAKKIIDKHKWPFKVSIRTIQNRCDGLISELVGRKIKSHGARKTFGAVCLEMGYSIESVAKFMGHSNPIITSQIYAHVTEAKIEREMKEIPKAVQEMMEQIKN